MASPPSFLTTHGLNASGAIFGDTIFGWNGCKVTVNGTAPRPFMLGQAAEHKVFWLYKDDSDWLLVNGQTLQVTTGPKAHFNKGSGKFRIANLNGTIVWN